MRRKPRPNQYAVFLELLKAGRREARLTQKELAKELGRAQATVSKVESGEIWIDVIELRAWLRALQIDFIHFMQELDGTLGGPCPRVRSPNPAPRPGMPNQAKTRSSSSEG